jgi:hypothetical protein
MFSWTFLRQRRNGRLPRSTQRIVMLAVTTTMFALGLIALVLQTSLSYQQFAQMFSSSSTSLWSAHRIGVVTAVIATIARIIVSASFDIRCLADYPQTVHTQSGCLGVESCRAMELRPKSRRGPYVLLNWCYV